MNTQLTVWDHMSAAPHRSLFLAGALQGVLTLLWWVFDLTGRYAIAGSMTTWSIAPTWAHAFLITLFSTRHRFYHVPRIRW
ncbi:MAG TPA: hypothetical protein PKY67_03920, partial [Nitrosomonas sp.]|nr:hypothetical protein [Nitrosomonas sp.]